MGVAKHTPQPVGAPTSLEMAEGFFTRRISDFIQAARQQDSRWILLGDDREAIRYEQEPWRSREHRGWMCLFVAAAEGELNATAKAQRSPS